MTHGPQHSIRLAVISDTHVGGNGSSRWHGVLEYARAESYLRSAVAEANRANAQVLVALGDLTDRGDVQAMRLVRNALSAFDGRVVVVAGNHDRTIDNVAFEVEFDHGSDRVAVNRPSGSTLEGFHVDAIHVRSDDSGLTCSASPPATSTWPRGLVILLSHYPLVSVAAQLAKAGLRDSGQLRNADFVLSPLRERADPTLVLSGHVHARLETIQGPVLQLSVASLIEAPHELTLIDLIAHAGSIALTATRILLSEDTNAEKGLGHTRVDSDRTLPVLAPDTSTWSWAAGSWASQSLTDPITGSAR